ncbi:MAG: hypothetical protein GDA50_07695 [Alphaproteobacteria bacterium GM202ARS2]|nr:hypothetical protein [Alphaproteobacteria bacterium GM202ARS2]
MTLKPIDRRWLLKRITTIAGLGGAVVFARDTYFAWRRDQREQEKHDLALAYRQSPNTVRAQATGYLPTVSAKLTVSPLSLKGSGKVVPLDPTIPI